ncbi:MAG TPA: hypothetical protein VJR04_13030 [Terriglobales bacterium]|nr:hypothetical protein [Terriglobales bacterium]
MANLQKFPVGTTPLAEPSDDIDRRLRDLLAQSIRRSGKSREQIAEDMTRLLSPRRITPHMLNSWTAVTHDSWRFPAAYVLAFCEVTSDDTLLRFLLGRRLSALLALGEMIAHAVPSVLSRFETRRTARVNSDDPQELLFG